MRRNVIIPFNIRQINDEYDLLIVMIHAIDTHDFDIIHTYISDITDDVFEKQEELDLEIKRLSDIVENTFDVLVPHIKPLVNTEVFKSGFIIDDISAFGKEDTILTIGYW